MPRFLVHLTYCNISPLYGHYVQMLSSVIIPRHWSTLRYTKTVVIIFGRCQPHNYSFNQWNSLILLVRKKQPWIRKIYLTNKINPTKQSLTNIWKKLDSMKTTQPSDGIDRVWKTESQTLSHRQMLSDQPAFATSKWNERKIHVFQESPIQNRWEIF